MSRTRFDLNQVTAIGRIGQEPQYRETERAKVLTFSVATTERQRDGEDKTTWFNVVSFGDNGEFLSSTLAKGDRVAVTGRIELETYDRKDGTPGASLKVVADTVVPLTDKRNGNSGSAPAKRHQPEELPWE